MAGLKEDELIKEQEAKADQSLARHRELWAEHGLATQAWWAKQPKKFREEIWAKHMRCAINDSSKDIAFSDVDTAWEDLLAGRVDLCTRFVFKMFDSMLDASFSQRDLQPMREPLQTCASRAKAAGDLNTIQAVQDLLSQRLFFRAYHSKRVLFFAGLSELLIDMYLQRLCLSSNRAPFIRMMHDAQQLAPWWCSQERAGDVGSTSQVYDPFLRAFRLRRQALETHESTNSLSKAGDAADASVTLAHGEMLNAIYAAFFHNPNLLYYLTRSRKHPAPGRDYDVRRAGRSNLLSPLHLPPISGQPPVAHPAADDLDGNG